MAVAAVTVAGMETVKVAVEAMVATVATAEAAAIAGNRAMETGKAAPGKGFQRISGLQGAVKVHTTLTNEIRIKCNMRLGFSTISRTFASIKI